MGMKAGGLSMLVQCGECATSVSDKAERCPKCGAPTSEFRAVATPAAEPSAPARPTAPIVTKPSGGWGFWHWAGLGVVGFLLFKFVPILFGGGNVHIVNLRSEAALLGPTTVSGTLVNEGRAGNVWTWIEQGNNVMCPRSTYIEAKVRVKFSFTCDQIEEGRIVMKANRNPTDWVKKNARSL